jgi:hypothetical protein
VAFLSKYEALFVIVVLFSFCGLWLNSDTISLGWSYRTMYTVLTLMVSNELGSLIPSLKYVCAFIVWGRTYVHCVCVMLTDNFIQYSTTIWSKHDLQHLGSANTQYYCIFVGLAGHVLACGCYFVWGSLCSSWMLDTKRAPVSARTRRSNLRFCLCRCIRSSRGCHAAVSIYTHMCPLQ